MQKVDKKDVLETIIYNILKGLQPINQTKTNVEDYHETSVILYSEIFSI